jgi:hypothetical protein
VLLFSFALSVGVGLVFGLAPALRLSRGDASEILREGGRGGTHGMRRHRMMRGLVVTEMALALVLAVGAGLVLQSFWHLRMSRRVSGSKVPRSPVRPIPHDTRPRRAGRILQQSLDD